MSHARTALIVLALAGLSWAAVSCPDRCSWIPDGPEGTGGGYSCYRSSDGGYSDCVDGNEQYYCTLRTTCYVI